MSSSRANVKDLLFSSSGNGGNSLLSMPTRLKMDPRVEMVAFGLPVEDTLTSISANSRTILNNSFTGSVTEPVSSTSAETVHFIPRSKFVVDKDMAPSLVSIKTFCKMGIVFREPTTLETSCNPAPKWSLLILKFIKYVLKRV